MGMSVPDWRPQNGRTPETAHAAVRIVELRRQRATWPDIAKAMGMTSSNVRKLYNRALAEIPAQHIDEHRAEELTLIDDATANLMGMALDEKVSHRSRIEAWNSIRAWAERKAKLLGLDAPTQVVTIDKVDQEIAALQRELATMDAQIDAQLAK
jgi:methylphosphotriester-DNA--protein-cysteine methyltransferase